MSFLAPHWLSHNPSIHATPAAQDADFISVHVPYFNRATHHLINAENLQLCKRGVHLVNFSPAQIVDGAALRAMFDSGRLTGRYIADFADPYLQVWGGGVVGNLKLQAAFWPRCDA